MQRALASIAFGFAVILISAASRAQSQPRNGDPEDRMEATHRATEVRSAPGGGEMLILGPELRHVIDARAKQGGGLEIGCRRDVATTGTEQTGK